MAQSVLIPLPPPPHPPKQYIDFFFLHVQSDHGGGKQFLRWMQKNTVEGCDRAKTTYINLLKAQVLKICLVEINI